MASGITSLHPRLGWGSACDPRAVQLQHCEIQGTSAGFEGVAFPFLTLQRGRSLVSICPHPTKPFPTPSSSPWSPHIPSSSSDARSKPKGRKMVFGCVYMWAEGREGTDLSQGTLMEVRAEQLFPAQGQPFGSPWLCVKALRLRQGSFPPGMCQNVLSKTAACA